MTALSPYSIPPLFSSICFILLGIFVFLKNNKSKINISFLFLCFVTFWWQFSWFVLFNFNTASYSTDIVNFIVKIGYSGIVLIPVIFFHFFVFLLKSNKRVDKFLLYFSYLITIAFEAAIWFTDFFVKGFYIYHWGFYPKAGFFHIVYLFFLATLASRVFYFSLLYLRDKKTIGSYGYYQIKYVLLALLFYVLSASDFIVNYGYGFYPVGFIFILAFLIIFAYAIVRYRLMDIRLVVRKSTIFTALVVFLACIYSSLAFLFSRLFENAFGTQSRLVISLIVSIFVVVGFQPLKLFVQNVTKRFLFKEEYDPQSVVAELADVLASSLELKHLFSSVNSIIDKTLHPISAATSLLDKKKGGYILAYKSGFSPEVAKKLNFDAKDPLVAYFKVDKNVIVLQELRRKVETGYLAETDKIKKLISTLEATASEVFLPLISKENIIGITFLGAKKSGDVYTAEDIRLLEIGASQAAVAIENSLMYEAAKNFNVTLTKEVEKATRELRLANTRLKKLDETKSEFISIASHQLRTPLTVIKGYISMMLEGSFGQLTDQAVESLHKVYESNQRLINLVEDLLNISRIESGRIQYNMADYGLDDLAASVVDELANNAKNKKLYLKLDKPDKPLPKVKMDTDKLRQVLMNMVDNAIKYTTKGGIRVSVYQEGRNLVLKVIDTGMGIDPVDLPNLFQKFSRGQGMSKVHTEGVGLGLYVAKQMLEAHGGKIWAESKGKDLGSAFCITIPIKKS
ncbi:MAG: ATP-binding protein [Patescibacteria group bacterium]|jgi:signal transduction histidine kinase